jgi:hypothetical protein
MEELNGSIAEKLANKDDKKEQLSGLKTRLSENINRKMSTLSTYKQDIHRRISLGVNFLLTLRDYSTLSLLTFYLNGKCNFTVR